MAWNASEITNTIHELRELLYLQQSEILIIIVTKLTKTKKAAKYKIQGYHIIRQDCIERRGDGLIIFVKNNINFNKYNIKMIKFEAIAVKIKHSSPTFMVVAIYNLCGRKLYVMDLDKFFKLHRKVIIIGVWNARNENWNCHINNEAGNICKNILITITLRYVIWLVTSAIPLL